MLTRLLFISSFIFPALLYAQEDSLVVQKSYIKLDVYGDYGKALMSFTDFETKYAGGANITFFSHYFLTAEYGQATLNPENAFENVDYQSKGSFYRIGVGYIMPFKNTYSFGLGGRYGLSQFEERGIVEIPAQSDLVDSYTGGYRRENLNSNWFEVFILSEKQLLLKKSDPSSILNNIFKLGFTFQVRRMIEYDRFSPIDVYSIPGYGRSFDKVIPAINVYIKARLVEF